VLYPPVTLSALGMNVMILRDSGNNLFRAGILEHRPGCPRGLVVYDLGVLSAEITDTLSSRRVSVLFVHVIEIVGEPGTEILQMAQG